MEEGLVVPDPSISPVPVGWWEDVAEPIVMKTQSWDELDDLESQLLPAISFYESKGRDTLELEKALRIVEKRRGDLLGPEAEAGGRGKTRQPTADFSESGSERTQRNWRQLARYWDKVVRPSLVQAKTIKQARQTTILKGIADWVAHHARHQQATKARKVIGDQDHGVRVGAFTETLADVPDGSIDLIFTDPPYRDEDLHVYTDLGTFAARVLAPGGSLLTYIGQHRLPEILQMVEGAGLTFFWPIAMVHTGASARMTEYGIVVKWKPILWFVKGPFRRRDNMRFVDDLIMSTPPTKQEHAWQQSVTEARYYIEGLTNTGDLVIDPFCGSGTTAMAAAACGRRWLTCDVDADHVAIARQRIAEGVHV